MTDPLWVTYTQPYIELATSLGFSKVVSSRIRAEARRCMCVHSPKQIHRLEVINRRTPPARTERLVILPIELQHAIYVFDSYIWHDWLCPSTKVTALAIVRSRTDFPQTWQ